MNIFFKKGLRQEVRSITFPGSSFPPNDPNWKHELRQRESALQDYASVTLKEFYSLFLYYMFILIYLYFDLYCISIIFYIYIPSQSRVLERAFFLSLFFLSITHSLSFTINCLKFPGLLNPQIKPLASPNRRILDDCKSSEVSWFSLQGPWI